MSTEQEDTRLTPEEELSTRSPQGCADAPPQAGDDDVSDVSEEAAAGGASDSQAGTAEVPADYLEEVKAKAEERDRFLTELQRARADLDNLQKRTRRERPQLERKGARRVLSELLGVVDNFERALESLKSDASDGAKGTSGLEEGVRMIHQQLENVLHNQGVREIAALGETFNPEYHEAVTQEKVEDRPTGEVVEVLQRGYLHYDAVLRPTAVKVALNVADRSPSSEEPVSEKGGGPEDDSSDAAARRSDADT